jgi:DNA-binding GntR family transcriptional regulator
MSSNQMLDKQENGTDFSDNWQASHELPKTREEVVAAQLRQAILHGHFKPGDKLDQADISERLRVSRSPVREALRTLAAEGLITMYPHRGAVVTELSAEEIKELHVIRGVLEGLAIQQAIPYLGKTHFEKLKGILEQADMTENHEQLQALNQAFHQTIYESFRQPQLIGMINHLRNKIAPYIRLYLDAGRKQLAWADHRNIYEACCKQDAALAEALTKAHLEQVCQGILAALNEGQP